MFRQSPVPHALVHFEGGQFLEVNDAWLQQSGFGIGNVIGRTALESGLWGDPKQLADV